MEACENCGSSTLGNTDATQPVLCAECASEWLSLRTIMLRHAKDAPDDTGLFIPAGQGAKAMFEWYGKAVQRTESPYFYQVDPRIVHAAFGLATEAGEILDAVKKAMFYGDRLDLVNLFEEGGDLMWYFMLLCLACDWSVPAILEANVLKLKHRYPEKFEQFQALNRDLQGERQVLEDEHDGSV